MSRRPSRTNMTPEKADARIERARFPAGVTRDSERADAGWGNIMMGLADVARDRREHSVPLAERHTYGELMELYRGNDLAARMCDRPAEDMTREGFETTIDGEEQMGDDMDAALDELQVCERFSDALRKSAAAGGAAILIGAVDGVGDASLPLNEKALQRIDFLTVLDSRELYPTSYYADPLAPKFGIPRTYRVQPAFLTGGYAPGANEPQGNSGDGRGKGYTPTSGYVAGSGMLQVHESRIIRFPGVDINRWQMRETLGWGDSKLERPWKVLRNHDLSWDAASYLMTDFAQAVFKMDGLKEAVANGGAAGAKTVQDRASIMEIQRSFMRMVLIGKDDEFERQQTPIAGLADILDRFAKRFAAAADIPVEILWGESPAGLNATGSNTVRNYYDRIKARQKREITPAARRLIRLLFLAKRGPTKGVDPGSWNITHRSLWQPTDQETADAYLKFAQGDASNVTSQILEPEEIAIARYGGRKFGTVVRVKTETREKFLNDHPPAEAKGEAIENGEADHTGAPKPPPPVIASPGKPPPGAPAKSTPPDPAAPKA